MYDNLGCLIRFRSMVLPKASATRDCGQWPTMRRIYVCLRPSLASHTTLVAPWLRVTEVSSQYQTAGEAWRRASKSKVLPGLPCYASDSWHGFKEVSTLLKTVGLSWRYSRFWAAISQPVMHTTMCIKSCSTHCFQSPVRPLTSFLHQSTSIFFVAVRPLSLISFKEDHALDIWISFSFPSLNFSIIQS